MELAFIVFLVSVLLLCVLALVRNEVVYKIRIKRIDTISAVNHQRIRECDYSKGNRANLLSLDGEASYEEMMWDLRKWTYKQFFPKGY